MKLIKNWGELNGLFNDKYQIFVEDCCGWIIPLCDEPAEHMFNCHCKDDKDYFNNHVYLSTHTFYGSQYKYSTKILQEHGFDVEIDNWDKEEN